MTDEQWYFQARTILQNTFGVPADDLSETTVEVFWFAFMRPAYIIFAGQYRQASEWAFSRHLGLQHWRWEHSHPSSVKRAFAGIDLQKTVVVQLAGHGDWAAEHRLSRLIKTYPVRTITDFKIIRKARANKARRMIQSVAEFGVGESEAMRGFREMLRRERGTLR